MQHFHEQKHWRNDPSTLSPVTLCKQFWAQFRLCQLKNDVKTACESHDLKMDFCSFDNGFKQFRATNSMQECPLAIIFTISNISVIHDRTNKVACVTIGDSDHTGHSPNLISLDCLPKDLTSHVSWLI